MILSLSDLFYIFPTVIQFILAIALLEIDITVSEQEGKIKGLEDQIAQLKTSQIRTKLATEQITANLQLVSNRCHTCGTFSDVRKCDNCNLFYCQDDWAIHEFELCESGPYYDPNWDASISK